VKCSGHNASTGEVIEVEFDSVITHVDPLFTEADRSIHIAPGFIDIQMNGFAGVDYNSPDAAHNEIARSIDAVFSTGVTRFFPTVITGAPDKMLGALKNLAEARQSLEHGQAMEAFHVEGPHISPDDGPRGAHPKRWVRAPDVDEFHRLQDAAGGNIRLVTLAPEWPGATRYIEALTSQGVVISIGHTAATPAQIRDAIQAGATLSTHLGNGGHTMLPKFPNYLWTQLAEDRLAASFIADGIHLDRDYFRTALRSKGTERSILITDAVMPALCAPGFYDLGETPVELHEDGRVTLRGGTRLAGSSLRIDRAIENVMRVAGVSLVEAIAMATVNPARVARIRSRQRSLSPGERADLVRFSYKDGRVEIEETWMSGKKVFSHE
jgi:N-acetylglucosamine-6-phosphate deacetylase